MFDHEVSSKIRFVTDGRGNDWPRHDTTSVFGELVSGPAFKVGLTVKFAARLTRPDHSSLWADAVLDYPADPELVEETECFVLLHNVTLDEVPAGTIITSSAN